MKRLCPYTNEEITRLDTYFRGAKKRFKKNIDELRIDFYMKNYPDVVTYDRLYDLYINRQYSLPDFKKEFGFNYHTTLFLLNYYKIPKRDMSTAGLVASPKREKSCIERYGVSNPSQAQEVKDKKADTFNKHYGVDNVFATQEFKDKLNDYFIGKHGESMPHNRSRKSKEVWKSKNKEERNAWLENSIHSEKTFNKRKIKGYQSSKLESRISEILTDLNIEHTRQFTIKFNKNRRRHFDFHINGTNILIEFNGDYWHANPTIYKDSDIVHFRFGDVLVKDIWEKDMFKKQVAIDKGYVVVYIWENEINKLTNEKIAKIIKDKIEAVQNQNH
jgi:hypothetical protein